MSNWDPTITSQERGQIIRDYALRHPDVRNFVESGSADGDTCVQVQDLFDHLYTIEIVPTVQIRTKRRLSIYPHVLSLQGDSTHILPGLLDRIGAPCLFWLDGHYCGSLEKRGEKDTPVADELQIIFATNLRHIILVDDARLFGTDPAYPTIEWVREIATSQAIEFTFSYQDDMMRIVPK